MKNIGLTGNIAAGKSAVADHFRAWGAMVIDSDRVVRDVQSPGSPVLQAIARRFGEDVIGRDGELNRAQLRKRVFGDPDALAALNAIVHPAVQRRRDELLAKAETAGYEVVVSDIPLLFEVLDPQDFDAIVLVDAPETVRRERLVTLRGVPGEQADRMIASQMPASEKRALSDHIIDNLGTLEDLEKGARKVWRELAGRAS